MCSALSASGHLKAPIGDNPPPHISIHAQRALPHWLKHAHRQHQRLACGCMPLPSPRISLWRCHAVSPWMAADTRQLRKVNAGFHTLEKCLFHAPATQQRSAALHAAATLRLQALPLGRRTHQGSNFFPWTAQVPRRKQLQIHAYRPGRCCTGHLDAAVRQRQLPRRALCSQRTREHRWCGPGNRIQLPQRDLCISTCQQLPQRIAARNELLAPRRLAQRFQPRLLGCR